MLVEFVRQHLQFEPGRVVDLAGGVAAVLIKRGVARPMPVAEVVPPPPVPAEPPVEEQTKPKKKGK